MSLLDHNFRFVPTKKDPEGPFGFSKFLFELLAEAELFEELRVAVDIGFGEVVEKAATLADEDEKATMGSGILAVVLDVGGEVLDTRGKKGDLDFGGAAVFLVLAELLDDRGGLVFVKCHSLFSPYIWYLASSKSNLEKGSDKGGLRDVF